MTGALARSPTVEPHTLGVPLGVEEVAVEVCSSEDEFGSDVRSLASGDNGKAPQRALARQELPTPPAICDPSQVRDVLDAASMKLRRSISSGFNACSPGSFRSRGSDLCKLIPRRIRRERGIVLSPTLSRPLSTKADPPVLRMTSPNGQTDCAGEYMLVATQRPNGQLLWKHRENERWLFYTTEGKWSVGGPKEKGDNFACCTGYIYRNSAEVETLPNQGIGTWERWDGSQWVEDLAVMVAAAPDLRSLEDGLERWNSRSGEAAPVTSRQLEHVAIPSPSREGPSPAGRQGASRDGAGARSPSSARHPRFTASDLREGLCQLRQRVARLGETCASLEALTSEYGTCGTFPVAKLAIAEEHTRLMNEVAPQLTQPLPEQEHPAGAAGGCCDGGAVAPPSVAEPGDSSLAMLRQYVASLTTGKGVGGDGGLAALDQLVSSMMGPGPNRPLTENSPRNLHGRESSRGRSFGGVPLMPPDKPMGLLGLSVQAQQLVLPALQTPGLQVLGLPGLQPGLQMNLLQAQQLLLPAVQTPGLQAPAGLQVNLYQASPLCTPRGFFGAQSFDANGSPSPVRQ